MYFCYIKQGVIWRRQHTEIQLSFVKYSHSRACAILDFYLEYGNNYDWMPFLTPQKTYIIWVTAESKRCLPCTGPLS